MKKLTSIWFRIHRPIDWESSALRTKPLTFHSCWFTCRSEFHLTKHQPGSIPSPMNRGKITWAPRRYVSRQYNNKEVEGERRKEGRHKEIEVSDFVPINMSSLVMYIGLYRKKGASGHQDKLWSHSYLTLNKTRRLHLFNYVLDKYNSYGQIGTCPLRYPWEAGGGTDTQCSVYCHVFLYHPHLITLTWT